MYRVVIIIVSQFIKGGFNGCYNTASSLQHLVVLSLLLLTFSAVLLVELAIIVVGSRGTPLEVSKRRLMRPLLTIQLALWVLQLMLAVYGSWVVSAQPLTLPEEACWYRYNRKQILRDLLYTAWGLSVYDWLRVLVFYNMFPVADDLRSWLRRIKLVSCMLGSRKVFKAVQGHIGAGPKGELSQLYGGVMHGVDLTPTDQLAAMLLLRQVQNARRHRHAQDRRVDPGAAPGNQARCAMLCQGKSLPLSASQAWHG
ncbi:hypothetical protein CVIRNUC_006353 [Coccomyxa viridis]|uniref:Uncharacterized protein n=1 Tax=Coccomyxa viridis TaxID=1274662 RepID=A0AAV1IB39_9CHLO|nr:hypothetical protein CVIRNUC_006353 [Coccomyxa viridis]